MDVFELKHKVIRAVMVAKMWPWVFEGSEHLGKLVMFLKLVGVYQTIIKEVIAKSGCG